MEPTRAKPPIAALFILLFVALILTIVSLVRAAGTSPLESWIGAMHEGDYAGAALMLTDDGGVEDWLTRTESLALQHGEVVGFQRTENILLPPGKGFISTLTVNWEDGYVRCLLLRQREDGSLGLIGEYFDCGTLADRVPEGGQLLPEELPDDPGGTPPVSPDLPPAPDAPPVR